MPDFMHQCPHKRLWLDYLVSLRGTHPEHDRRRRPPARIIWIEQPVQFAARIAWPDAANLYVYRRGAEPAAYLGGERASASGGRRKVAGLERPHQRVHRAPRRDA